MSTFQAPKGTYDLLPPDSAKYLAVREAIAAPLRDSGYGYIETPGFESVELFARGAIGVRLQREVQQPQPLREQQQRDGGAADQHRPTS